MGPWKAAQMFLEPLDLNVIKQLKVKLFGSLSKTGKGHGTDIAVMLGLEGYDVKTVDVNEINNYIERINSSSIINLSQQKELKFCPSTHIQFKDYRLEGHPNALTFFAYLSDGTTVEETYYSVGGGFVIKENEDEASVEDSCKPFPFPIQSEADILKYIEEKKVSIYDIVHENELAWRSEAEIDSDVIELWSTMKSCIYRGCHQEGILPGGLNVTRRANKISTNLIEDRVYDSSDEWIEEIKKCNHSFTNVTKWVSCFALAVNEENASFGRVVTAPTNGAAGVIPAVLMYMLCFTDKNRFQNIKEFILVAGEIGALFKKGSTISAAMGGCQAEIGVSSAMAAAGITQCLGGSHKQVLQAAEIAMEHHLGMTCDPIMGLVQVPCIERNIMGAMKAITASQVALAGDPEIAKVTLDQVIKTMKETAAEMSEKFKETSEGGLAVNISVAVPEC
jgi:L-serine dehydratase